MPRICYIAVIDFDSSLYFSFHLLIAILLSYTLLMLLLLMLPV